MTPMTLTRKTTMQTGTVVNKLKNVKFSNMLCKNLLKGYLKKNEVIQHVWIYLGHL